MKLNEKQYLGANYAYLLHPFSDFIRSMERLQIHAIEFYAAAPHLYIEDFTSEDVRVLRRRLDDSGIAVQCFTAEQCNYPISLATEDEKMRRRSLYYYERALEMAAVLGAPLMQMISGIGLLSSSREENLKRSLDGLAHMADLAGKMGITIVLEADPNCTVANTSDQLAAIRAIDSPHLSGMIDTNALALNGEDFQEAVSALGQELRHIHFIDIDTARSRFCLVPGEGTLPMTAYLDVLAAAGYRGSITPELWGTTYLQCAEDAMERCVTFFKAYLERS